MSADTPARTPLMAVHDRFEAVAGTGTRSPAERSVILAAIRWADGDGVLWPSIASWARMAGVTRRGLQLILRRLVDRGVVEVVGDEPGSRGVRRYRIPALARPTSADRAGPAPTSTCARGAQVSPDTRGIHQRTPCAGGAHRMRRGGARRAPEQPLEQPVEQKQQQPKGPIGRPCTTRASAVGGVVVVDAFTQLRIEDLRNHPNATPQRLAWIEREAPRARNPAGWARACIVEGWAVPEPTPEQVAAARRARLDAVDRAYRRLPRDQRRALLERAQAEHPRLRERTDGDFELTGAAKLLLAKELGVYPDTNPKQTADYGYPQGRNVSPEAIGSILGRSVGEGVHGDAPRKRTPQKRSNGVIRRSG